MLYNFLRVSYGTKAEQENSNAPGIFTSNENGIQKYLRRKSLEAKAPIKQNYSLKPLGNRLALQTWPFILYASSDIITRNLPILQNLSTLNHPGRPSDIVEKLRPHTPARLTRDHKLFAVYERAVFPGPGRNCA